MLRRLEREQDGVELVIAKGLPISGGQGGSAASAVAGGFVANAALGDSRCRPAEVLAACLDAEAAVAGRHLDNLAPSLLGNVVLVRSLDPIDVVSLPVPAALRVVLAHPAQELRTADARSVLPASVPREVAIHQSAQVAAMVAALFVGDLRCSAAPSTIGSPSRRAGTCCPASSRPRRRRSRRARSARRSRAAGRRRSRSPTARRTRRASPRRCGSPTRPRGVACTVRVAQVDGRGARLVHEPGAFA